MQDIYPALSNADMKLFASGYCHDLRKFRRLRAASKTSYPTPNRSVVDDSSSSDNRVCSQHTLRQRCRHLFTREFNVDPSSDIPGDAEEVEAEGWWGDESGFSSCQPWYKLLGRLADLRRFGNLGGKPE